jgi:hypothetical protein
VSPKFRRLVLKRVETERISLRGVGAMADALFAVNFDERFACAMA